MDKIWQRKKSERKNIPGKYDRKELDEWTRSPVTLDKGGDEEEYKLAVGHPL